VTKLLITGCTTIFGSIGWYAAQPLGFFAAFIASVVGTAVGVYAGRQLANRWGF
jgi:uncharacterized membrane protein YfcA